MICIKCRKAGDLLVTCRREAQDAQAVTVPGSAEYEEIAGDLEWALDDVRDLHAECEAATTCPCLHRLG